MLGVKQPLYQWEIQQALHMHPNLQKRMLLCMHKTRTHLRVAQSSCDHSQEHLHLPLGMPPEKAPLSPYVSFPDGSSTACTSASLPGRISRPGSPAKCMSHIQLGTHMCVHACSVTYSISYRQIYRTVICIPEDVPCILNVQATLIAYSSMTECQPGSPLSIFNVEHLLPC